MTTFLLKAIFSSYAFAGAGADGHTHSMAEEVAPVIIILVVLIVIGAALHFFKKKK